MSHIKVSRGEENIFIWCFFLAIVQLAMDRAEAYKWVKYIYIDDPISSLDEQQRHRRRQPSGATVSEKGSHRSRPSLSSHHSLFFNVLWNEFGRLIDKKFAPYFSSTPRKPASYLLTVQQSDTPFFHHVALLQELYEARKADELYTHHFNALRSHP